MSAKEMFEELGYMLWEGSNDKIILFNKEDISIRFNLQNEPYLTKKTISVFYKNDKYVYEQEIILSFKELQAINKQVEELGWE